MSVRSIQPASGPVAVTLDAPPSKSVTHRALVAAALARGESSIVGPLVADDTRITLAGLEALGLGVATGADRWAVAGQGGVVPGGGRLELGQSGTSLRFLLALAALGERPSRLDGHPRLRERPVEELVQALRALGATVEPERAGTGSRLPLIAGGTRPRGGPVSVGATRSSQFASALLLVGCRLEGGLELTLGSGAVSLPYVQVTVDVLRSFGVPVDCPEPLRFRVAPAGPRAGVFHVEGDHSSASYFLAAAAIVGGEVWVKGLRRDSAQADARLGRILERLGCAVTYESDRIGVKGTGSIPGFELDAGDAPDLVPTLAVLGLFADAPVRLHGIGHLRLKESDRLAVLASNLTALGRQAMATDDELILSGPPERLHGGVIRTAGDHRIAMAFAVAGLRIPGVAIDDATCVGKSNPGFWTAFDALERGRPRTGS